MKKNVNKIPADMQELYKEFKNDKELFSLPKEWDDDFSVMKRKEVRKDQMMFLLGIGLFFLTLLVQMIGKGFELISLFVVCLRTV